MLLLPAIFFFSVAVTVVAGSLSCIEYAVSLLLSISLFWPYTVSLFDGTAHFESV